MCGIAGQVGADAGNAQRLQAMIQTLEHRGPDEAGVYVGNNVAIGMRRLSIIDVAGGQQPVQDESGRYQLVFNGEIYNFKELRKSLVSQGHKFNSDSDSEVIVHLYESKGINSFSELRGMFAIAIWDIATRTLILARDHLGKKPLMYASVNGNLLFASESKAILKAAKQSGFDFDIDFDALNNFLTLGYVPSPQNAFRGINSLKPGSVLVWNNGNFKETAFWTPHQDLNTNISYSEAVSETDRLLKQAVKRRLVSERPLGAFLSGGIDSALISAVANSIGENKLATFTIGFNEHAYDESMYAEEVAKHLGTNHQTFKSEVDPVLLLTQLGSAFDQPFADSSALPTMLLSAKTREHVVVALSGDGGDEIFLGYERYKYLPRLQRFNSVLQALKPMSGTLGKIASSTHNRKLKRLVKEFESFSSLNSRYIAGMTMIPVDLRRNILHNDFQELIFDLNGPEQEYADLISRFSDLVPAIKLAHTDISRYLPDDLLVKVDIASMKSSLEVRAPLLDLDLVNFALTLPKEIHMHKGESKSLLKSVLSNYLPRELFDRPKMGFAIPRANWLRNELHEMAHDLLLDQTAQSRHWMNTASVERVLKRHDDGFDQDEVIWPLLCLELWARNWLDASRVN